MQPFRPVAGCICLHHMVTIARSEIIQVNGFYNWKLKSTLQKREREKTTHKTVRVVGNQPLQRSDDFKSNGFCSSRSRLKLIMKPARIDLLGVRECVLSSRRRQLGGGH